MDQMEREKGITAYKESEKYWCKLIIQEIGKEA